MKTFAATLAFIATTNACMSDAACNQGNSDVTMCCFMNDCVPSSRVGCSGSRLDFYRHLGTKDSECEMSKFSSELRKVSEKVIKCDQLGLHCIDYVTEVMTDPGAFDLLEGVAEMQPM